MASKYNDTGVKKDCFAYKEANDKRKYGSCDALNALYCRKEICNFYKPRSEVKE